MRILHTKPQNTNPDPEAVDMVVRLLDGAMQFGDLKRSKALVETLVRHCGNPNPFVPARLRRQGRASP